MNNDKAITPCRVNVSSETGRLRAVLLHRPGVEIECMTPLNAGHALYSDILNKSVVDEEYANFSGVLERWTQVYYVEDILTELLKRNDVRQRLVQENLTLCGTKTTRLADKLLDETAMPPRQLARTLIEGYEDPNWDGENDRRYLMEPLYNLFFTRDASSTIFDRVLINSMRTEVRERETLLYESIFQDFFGVELLNSLQWHYKARTEGGDVHIAAPDLLCVGQSQRTNAKGLEYLVKTFAAERDHFNILVQELPKSPESFIHLDMVFSLLGKHYCTAFAPMLTRKGLFGGLDTTLITIDHGKVTYNTVDNIVAGLHKLGWDIEPVLVGGDDPWMQLREQWHSGANFFALGDCKVMGYRRNVHTIDALDKKGFAVLKAEDIIAGRVAMNDYDRFVATMPGSDLPRGGGGARCMTMPILRD